MDRRSAFYRGLSVDRRGVHLSVGASAPRLFVVGVYQSLLFNDAQQRDEWDVDSHRRKPRQGIC